ncbi:MAG: type II toxin-antitoxin system RelE/ParE family toxin [Acidobacteria bacterium]|nr:type II toxin-antitoxin system RelE/ParE family toxin [Acidobacteriota bacterium]
MACQVVLADSAKEDANQIYDWVVERAPVRGAEWLDMLMDRLYSLEQMPHRGPLAREAAAAKREIRCLLFGKRGRAYRILYEVDERRRTVCIRHIRHGAVQDIDPEGLSPQVFR